MELQISGKNMEISDELHRYVEKRLGKLTRHLPRIIEAKVEISTEATKTPEQRYVVQVTLNHSGTLLRGEHRALQLHAAIDKVAELMDRKIERYKGKLYKKGKRISLIRSEPVKEAAPSRVVRVKRFPVKPMSPQEAVEQMELLGHDFFLFLDAESGEFNLLYRRKAGDYGLIQPELA